jgi:hypothetical protein
MRTSSLSVDNKMKDDEMGRARAAYGQGNGGRDMCTGLWYRKLNRLTGRPRRISDDNIEVDLQYIR